MFLGNDARRLTSHALHLNGTVLDVSVAMIVLSFWTFLED